MTDTSSKNRSPLGIRYFQRWKRKFPREEKKISNVGNLFFQGWKLFGKLISDILATGGAVRKPYKQVAPLGANQAGLLGVLDFYGETRAGGSGLVVWRYYSIAMVRRAFC